MTLRECCVQVTAQVLFFQLTAIYLKFFQYRFGGEGAVLVRFAGRIATNIEWVVARLSVGSYSGATSTAIIL